MQLDTVYVQYLCASDLWPPQRLQLKLKQKCFWRKSQIKAPENESQQQAAKSLFCKESKCSPPPPDLSTYLKAITLCTLDIFLHVLYQDCTPTTVQNVRNNNIRKYLQKSKINTVFTSHVGRRSEWSLLQKQNRIKVENLKH